MTVRSCFFTFLHGTLAICHAGTRMPVVIHIAVAMFSCDITASIMTRRICWLRVVVMPPSSMSVSKCCCWIQKDGHGNCKNKDRAFKFVLHYLLHSMRIEATGSLPKELIDSLTLSSILCIVNLLSSLYHRISDIATA